MAGARAGEDIRIGDGEAALPAYLALPAAGHGHGVVVLQAWWGLVPHVRDVCDRFAREGFVALAPDLYRGERTTDPDVASRLMMDLDVPRASADLGTAVTHLRNHHTVDGAKVGCIGFCMGGQLALFAACEHDGIGAVVDCYGIHPNVQPDLGSLSAAFFGVFAENDEFVPVASARALERALREAGARADVKIYLGVQHAFMNDSRPDVYDAHTASEAWSDLLAFLRAELR